MSAYSAASGPGWNRIAAAAGRVAIRRAQNHRLVRAACAAARATASSFARVLHLLWLQVTGLFFLVFAAAGAVACWREYHTAGIASGRTLLAFGFSAMFAWFGVSSFWRAGRKRT